LAASPSCIRSRRESDLVGLAGESSLGHGTIGEAGVEAVRNRIRHNSMRIAKAEEAESDNDSAGCEIHGCNFVRCTSSSISFDGRSCLRKLYENVEQAGLQF